jgi:hypothetical protein
MGSDMTFRIDCRLDEGGNVPRPSVYPTTRTHTHAISLPYWSMPRPDAEETPELGTSGVYPGLVTKTFHCARCRFHYDALVSHVRELGSCISKPEVIPSRMNRIANLVLPPLPGGIRG